MKSVLENKTKRLLGCSHARNILHLDMEYRLNKRGHIGVVDLKVTVNSSRNSKTNDLLWAINNVLRLREKGCFESELIG